EPLLVGRRLRGLGQELVDLDRLVSAADGDRIEAPEDELVSDMLESRLADDGIRAVVPVQALEAACEIHRVADGRVVQPIAAADVAHHHPPGVEPDMSAEV